MDQSPQQLLDKHFPNLTKDQRDRLIQLEDLYRYWNERVNLVSRKDIDNLFLHHIVHSLSLIDIVDFGTGMKVIDAGTGGGFPGIPLAICYPETEFLLVDSTAKKLNIVDSISDSLKLQNVTTFHMRLEEIQIENDAIVSRAVSALPRFVSWVRHLTRSGGAKHRGIYYLKGGDVEAEAKSSGMSYALYALESNYPYNYFKSKYIVHLLP